MITIFVVILLVSLIALVVGLIKPTWVLFWQPPEKRRRKKALIWFGFTSMASMSLLWGLIFNWIMFIVVATILLICFTLVCLVIGLIKPSTVMTYGNRTRKRVLVQYTSAFLLSFILLVVVASFGSLEEEVDETILLGKYVGEREADLRHGEGKLSNNTASYEGTWEENKRNGFGTEVIDLGLLATIHYEGQWVNDKRHGEGTETVRLLWLESSYKGNYVNGEREGYGEVVDRKGNIFKGQWVDDSPNGEGEMIFTNGDVYQGEVKDWMKHGYGKATLSDGEVLKGEWVEDELVE